jgi:hypothetical protein
MGFFSILTSTASASAASLFQMETFFPSSKVAMDENESIEEFLRFCQLLRDNDPSTTTVSIGHHVDQAKTAALCEALEENTQVHRIRLDFANDLVASRPLLNCLQYSPKLSIVDLYNMNFNEAAACTTLLLLLKGIARNRAVRELTVEATLPDTSIFGRVSAILHGTQKDCLLLHSGIAASFRQLKFIEYLWLEHIDDVIICQILPSLRHLCSLKSLSLIPSLPEQSDSTFDSIGALLTTSQSLQQLELYDCLLTGSRMNAVVRGLWNSDSVTKFGLHTSRLDAAATDRLRALYCRKHKEGGASISALTVGQGVKLRVPLVGLLRSILGSGKSTLKCLDLKSRESSDEDVLRYLSGRSEEEDWFSVGWKSMTNDDKEVEVVEDIPQLVEIKWGKIQTKEGLGLFEDLVSNMTSLLRVSVEVDEALDPVNILSHNKASNIEICVVHGQRYDVKSAAKEAQEDQPKLNRRRKEVKRQSTMDSSDEEQRWFDGSFDGIGLESYEAQEIDEFCDQASLTGRMMDMGDPDCATQQPVTSEAVCQVEESKKLYNERRGNDDPTANSTQPIESSIKEETSRTEETNRVRPPRPAADVVVQGSQLSTAQSQNFSSASEHSGDQITASVKNTKRRVPSHTRSDTAIIARMRGRIVDIRKHGGLRNDPFYFERRTFDLNDYEEEASTQRPSLRSTASDTIVLLQMQNHRAQRFAAKNESQHDEPNLTEESEMDIAEELCSPIEEDPERFVPRPRTPAEEFIAMELHEQFADIIAMSQTEGTHDLSTSEIGSKFDLEEEKSQPNDPSEALSADCSVHSMSGLSSFYTADELEIYYSQEMQGSIKKESDDISKSSRRREDKSERTSPKNERVSASSRFHFPDSVDEISAAATTATALEPQEDGSSPKSFASATSSITKSVNQHPPPAIARFVAKDDVGFGSATGSLLAHSVNAFERDDDTNSSNSNSNSNSSSSELLDFDLELSKIMST